MLKVYTGTLWNDSPYKLDITVKSGDKVFAPTWDMVMGLKNGTITEEQYTDRYYNLMRWSYVHNRKRWEEVLNMECVVFSCFCGEGKFCHRYLLKDIFVKLGAVYLGEYK